MADGSVNLFSKFVVGNGSEDLAAEFRLRQNIYDLSAEFEVKHSENLYAKFVVKQQASQDLYAKFEVSGLAGSAELFGKLTVRPQGFRDLKGIAVIRQGTEELKAIFFLRHEASANLKGAAVIRHLAINELKAVFLLRHEASANLKGAATVRHSAARELKGVAVIRQAISKELNTDLIVGPIMGETLKGTANTQGEQYISGSWFTLSAPSRAKFIQVYCASTSVSISAAIYTENAGRPDKLIASTEKKTATGGWLRLNLLSQCNLDPGKYFLLVWMSAGIGLSYFRFWYEVSKGFDRNMSIDPGTWPATMTGGTTRSRRLSIFLHYTSPFSVSKNLSATFHVGQDSKNLEAEFRLRQDVENLYADFTVRYGVENLSVESVIRHTAIYEIYSKFLLIRTATRDRFSKFRVQHMREKDLRAGFELYQPFTRLFAKFRVVNSALEQLKAEFVSRHSASEVLKCVAIIRGANYRDIQAEFIPIRSVSIELGAEFNAMHFRDLKCEAYITLGPMDSWQLIVPYPAAWINCVQGIHRGFIKEPLWGDEAGNFVFESGHQAPKYKEISIGWLYEDICESKRLRQSFKDLVASFNIMTYYVFVFSNWLNYYPYVKNVGTDWTTVLEFYWGGSVEEQDSFSFTWDAMIRAWVPAIEYEVEMTTQVDGDIERKIIMEMRNQPPSGWYFDMDTGIHPISITRTRWMAAGLPVGPFTLRVKMKASGPGPLDVYWQHLNGLFVQTRIY